MPTTHPTLALPHKGEGGNVPEQPIAPSPSTGEGGGGGDSTISDAKC